MSKLTELGERLKELGINEADFRPKYHCKACNDTGYTARGFICNDCLKKFKEDSGEISCALKNSDG